MKVLLFIVGMLLYLPTNAQEISLKWIVDSFSNTTGNELSEELYHPNYHLMMNGTMYTDKISQLRSIKNFSNKIGSSPKIVIREKTITPSGHIMVIATIELEEES